MFQRCQLSNPAIEPGQIQDSLLVSPKQRGQLKPIPGHQVAKSSTNRMEGQRGEGIVSGGYTC